MADRPTAPILDVDERADVKAFYHNVAYKTNRVAINVEKMKVGVRTARRAQGLLLLSRRPLRSRQCHCNPLGVCGVDGAVGGPAARL
jgi:hypothetical protein